MALIDAHLNAEVILVVTEKRYKGEREIIYLSLHCHHQNDSCIKMGSDESHFNVSAGSDGQSHKTVSTNHNLFGPRKENRSGIEPRSFRLQAKRLTTRPNRLSVDDMMMKYCLMSSDVS